jgi:hypothetical protein
MADNGVSQSVRYGSGPLLVPAEIVSPHCGTYLTLLMKADRLFSSLEYLRPRGHITNTECDKEFARVHHLLEAVQRTALRLATGLRRRLNGPRGSDGDALPNDDDDGPATESASRRPTASAPAVARVDG